MSIRLVNLFPMRVWSWFFVVLGIVTLVGHLFTLGSSGYDFPFQLFTVINMVFYLVTGVGLLFEKRWAFRIFKGYLYVMMIGWPVGYYISRSTLSYLEREHIEEIFK